MRDKPALEKHNGKQDSGYCASRPYEIELPGAFGSVLLALKVCLEEPFPQCYARVS